MKLNSRQFIDHLIQSTAFEEVSEFYGLRRSDLRGEDERAFVNACKELNVSEKNMLEDINRKARAMHQENARGDCPWAGIDAGDDW